MVQALDTVWMMGSVLGRGLIEDFQRPLIKAAANRAVPRTDYDPTLPDAAIADLSDRRTGSQFHVVVHFHVGRCPGRRTTVPFPDTRRNVSNPCRRGHPCGRSVPARTELGQGPGGVWLAMSHCCSISRRYGVTPWRIRLSRGAGSRRCGLATPSCLRWRRRDQTGHGAKQVWVNYRGANPSG